jgi:hypothetical protein
MTTQLRGPAVADPLGWLANRSGQVTTMPAGAAPAGACVGELGSSVRLPPSTVKPLTVLAVGSTTQSVLPSGERRASSGVPAALIGVFRRRVSEPPFAIE